MAVTEGKILVGGTQDHLDTTEVTQTDGTVAQREAVVVADPETLAARAKVTNADDEEALIAILLALE